MTDKELYRRVAKGDESAFSELIVRYESMVYNIVYGVLGNRDDAFDAAQEALLRVWRSAGKYRGDCEVKTWIYRIAKNSALDALDARKRYAAVSIDDAALDDTDAVGAGESAEETAIQRENVRIVRAAIAMLPPDKREVIELRELYSMDYEQIAEVTHTPVGTVKSRLSRARRELYEILCEKFGFDGTKPSGTPSKGGEER